MEILLDLLILSVGIIVPLLAAMGNLTLNSSSCEPNELTTRPKKIPGPRGSETRTHGRARRA